MEQENNNQMNGRAQPGDAVTGGDDWGEAGRRAQEESQHRSPNM